ncbi:MAG: EAL domain-containing protein [Oceanospirillales bacterium]|nr:EAL domain-containing protein [Oceanospirillales bacterium]
MQRVPSVGHKPFNQHRLHVYDLIARHAPLQDSLGAIAALIERQLDGARVSIMLYDTARHTLSLTGGEGRFSDAYREAVTDLPVGPEVGTCGVVAHTRQMRITADIQADSNWQGFYHLAEQEGLRACWSCPIMGPDDDLLGTFATYYSHVRTPVDEEIELALRAAGLVALAIGHYRERQTREQTEAELRLLKRGIEASPNGVVIADALADDQPLIYASPAFMQISGYSRDEVLGRNCRFLQGVDTDPQALAQLRSAIRQHREVTQVLKNYRKDGTPFWSQISVSPLFDEQGACTHFVGVQQDITLQRESEELLAYQARYDRLTGLPNWKSFEQRLNHDYALSQQGRHHPLALLYIDLDDFKPVNEVLGHAVGDQLLIEVAKRIREQLEPGDMLTRMSGDEFVLLSGRNTAAEVADVAESILAALSPPFEIGGNSLHISASIGMAMSGSALSGRALDLVSQADQAMQQAKAQGCNTWYCYSTEVKAGSMEPLRLRRELADAINQQQLVLHYQPIVTTDTGRFVAAEALVRWLHPQRGMVSPAEFIPVAERTGQIIAIGRYVLQQACQDMADLRRTTGRCIPVSVNISPVQFRRSGFFDELKAILQASGLPPEQLVLEVTENVLMSGTESSIELLHRIRDMGVGVAIDDFGTGFSSLSYLRQLPVNKIKLDRSFICDITTSRGHAAIVQGIITMAHHLGLQVVAEGIETEAQREDLLQRECDLLQGFLFSRPVPMTALLALPEHPRG